MQVYTVQPGDSPARIAIKYAGCPKCAVDLVHANPHKRAVRYPNGFLTFQSLVPGERLWLPDEWLNGIHDARPPSYFAALPYADGVTRGRLGSPGTLSDYAALEAASSQVAAMAAMDDQSFSNAVGDAGTAINNSISEAYGSSVPAAASYAQDVQNGTQWAWSRNVDLARGIAASDIDTTVEARLDIQNALSTALGNARLALQALSAAPPILPPPPEPTPDPAPPAPLPAPPMPPPAPRPTPSPFPAPPSAVTAPQQQKLSTGAVVGIGLLGAGAVAGMVLLTTTRGGRR